MGEKSKGINILLIIIFATSLLATDTGQFSLYAGQKQTNKSQARAKKSDPVDLSIQDFTLSKSKIQPGEKISMQFRIRLKGKMKADAYADIYLTSQRHKYSAKNRIFRRVIKASHFDAAGIVHLQKYQNFPLTYPAGTYYLFLVVDSTKTIKEWNERNNVAVRTIQVKQEAMQQMASRPEANPDVAVDQLKVTPSEIKDGKPFNISFYVTNPGQVQIAEVAYTVYIKKKGGILGNRNHELHNGMCRNLVPGGRQQITKSASIPLNLERPDPPNYLYVHVDPKYKLNEKPSAKHNNTAKVPITVTITAWPDLAFKKVNSNLGGAFKNRLGRGQELKLDLTFKNYGNRKSEPCKYKVYIHYHDVRRTSSGRVFSAQWVEVTKRKYGIHQLKPQETQFSTLPFATGSWSTGQYQITIYADSDGQIIESNENNNKYQKRFKLLQM